MRVFLVGFMGAGKSTIGRLLAQRLGTPFLDLDGLVAEAFGLPVPEIFRVHGEEAFRAEENRRLAAAERWGDLIMATGGGTFEREPNRAVIRSLGVSVFLDVPWELLLRRLPDKRDDRPLFRSPEQAWQLFQRRLPFYRVADLSVRPCDDEDAAAVAGRIAFLLERL